jgi:hypothetical protein
MKTSTFVKGRRYAGFRQMELCEDISTDSSFEELSSEEIDNYGYLSLQDMCIDCDEVPSHYTEIPPEEEKPGKLRMLALSFVLLLVCWLTR